MVIFAIKPNQAKNVIDPFNVFRRTLFNLYMFNDTAKC